LPENVIRNGRVEPDAWRFVPAGEAAGPLPQGALAVPLAAWKARRAELLARGAALGVWLEPHEDPMELGADLDALDLVAVRFPTFTDGRGYSIAVALRTRLAFRGELRAFGDVGRDQLHELRRCGFDAFALPSHRDPEAALDGLATFTLAYQGGVDDPLPLFRKRPPAGSAR
jgi:uncharacterized protein (DUF934 family)